MLMALAVAGVTPHTGAAQTRSQLLYQSARRGVVTIAARLADRPGAAFGTGFFIDSTHVITCRHVLEDTRAGAVNTYRDKELRILGVTADDYSSDLIELAVERPFFFADSVRILPLAPTPADSGAGVLVVGSPQRYESSALTGTVSRIRSLPGGVRLLETTAPVLEGSSGSPVLNDDGNVVGVVSIGDYRNRLGLAISVEHVRALRRHAPVALDQWIAGAIHHVDFGELPIEDRSPPDLMRRAETKDFVGGYAFDRGVAMLNENNAKGALDMFIIAYELQPARADAWLYAGRAAALAGYAPQAVTMLDNARRLEPRNREPLRELALLYNAMHRFDDVETTCNRLLAIDSTDAAAWYNLGVARGEAGRDSLALVALDRALQFDPREAMVHYSRGRVFEHQARYADAEREFRAALALAPNLTDARARLADLLLRADRPRDAEVEFARVVQRDTSNADAWFGYGTAQFHLNKFRDAISSFQRSLRVRADQADAYGFLGSSYHALGDTARELDAYRNVVRLTPNDPYGHYSLGMATFAYLHDRAAALAEYEILKKLDARLAAQLFDAIYK